MPSASLPDAAHLLALFTPLHEPRVERTRKHPLINIVVVAVLGVLAGCEGWDDLHDWGSIKQPWLGEFLDLRAGIPSADVFRRVFEALRPKEFQDCFRRFIDALVKKVPGTKVIAVDGKTLRHSFHTATARTPLHLVHAWVAGHHILLGQVATDTKSNEITAIPCLLRLLSLEGTIVTMDAMGTQKDIVTTIVEGGAHYAVALKDNHPTLAEQVERALEPVMENTTGKAPRGQRHLEKSQGHGRQETRRVFAIPAPAELFEREEWARLATLVGIESLRCSNGKTSVERRYYLSSLPASARQLAGVIRSHWSVENQLHWCLDVQLGEDASRIRSRNGAENFAWLRRFALMKIKAYPNLKRGVAATQRLINASNELLLNILLAEIASGA